MKEKSEEDMRGKSKVMKCDSCKCELTIPGGYAGTGLCGPCATGESETLSERGDSW